MPKGIYPRTEYHRKIISDSTKGRKNLHMIGNTFYKNRKVVKIRLNKKCKTCHIEFLIYPCQKNTTLYCSRKCQDFARIGTKRPDTSKMNKEKFLKN
jgi:hypothetical protein